VAFVVIDHADRTRAIRSVLNCWPDHYDLRRISLHQPTPVYPHSLIWHTDNPHPALTTLRNHLTNTTTTPPSDTWRPTRT
jgi:hypothetical protein